MSGCRVTPTPHSEPVTHGLAASEAPQRGPDLRLDGHRHSWTGTARGEQGARPETPHARWRHRRGGRTEGVYLRDLDPITTPSVERR